MNTRQTRWIAGCVVATLLALAGGARAADGTWASFVTANPAGPTQAGQNWSVATNWIGSIIAGSVGTSNSTDTMKMLVQGHYTITLDNNYNVKFITNNIGPHSHAIVQTNGTSVLSLTSGGYTVGGAGDAGSLKFYTPIRLEGGSGGTYAFLNNNTFLYGTVSGTAQTGGNYDLVLGGSGSSEVYTDSGYVGNLADGTGGGTLSVIKTGSGQWYLRNANSYSGTTTVRSGTLSFANASAFGTGTSAIQLGDAGTAVGDNIELRIRNNITLSRNIVVNNFNTAGTTIISVRDNLGSPVFSGQITLNRNLTIHTENSGLPTFSGKITGTGGLIKTGANTATLSNGSNDYQGGTTINAGVLVATTAGALSTGSVVVNGGVLRANQGVGLSTASSLSLSGGVWESSANITRNLGSAANEVRLANTAGFSANGAAITVNLHGGANLVWGSTAGFNPTTLVLNESTANNTLTFSNALDLNGANRIIAVNANSATISASIANSTGTAGLIKSGGGTLVLAAANSFNGSVTVNGGTLTIKNFNSYAGLTTVSGGIFNLDYTGTSTGTNYIPNNSGVLLAGGTLLVNGTATAGQNTLQTIAGLTISNGASAVTVIQNGSRPVALNVGAITRTNGSVNFTLPSGTQNSANGILTTTGSANTKLGSWAMVGGNEWAAKSADNANIVAWSAVGTYVDVTRLSSGTKTIASSPGSDLRILEGTGTAGNITLAAAGTTDIGSLLHTATGGATTIDPGTTDILRLGADAGLALASSAQSLLIGTTAGDGTLTAGGAANTSGKITIFNNLNTSVPYRFTINSIIADNGSGVVSLEFNGNGFSNLAATNTFTGGVTINAGNVYASGTSTQVLGTGRLTLNGGLFSLHTSDGQSPANQVVGSIAGAGGSIRAGNRTLTFGTDNTSSTYQGGWDGGSFTKVGTGTTTVFSAASTVTGLQGVNVNGGMLRLGASKDFGTSVNVNTNGVLDLNGFNSSGDLYNGGVNAGGTLTTGSGIFTLTGTAGIYFRNAGLATITGNVALASNSRFRGDANSTLVIDGVLSSGAGNITADGNMQGTAVIRLSGSNPNTFSGVWAVSAGTTELNKTAGVNAIPTDVSMTAGTLKWLASDQIADTAVLTLNGAGLNLNGFNETVSSLVLTGAAFTSSSAGLLTLNASTGNVISVGTGVNISKDLGLNIALTGTNGGILFTADPVNQNRVMRIGTTTTGERTLDLGSVDRTINVTTNSSNINLSSGIEAEITSVISGTGGIIKNGVGDLKLLATNTYSGNTVVNAGTLTLTGRLLNSTNLTVNGGGNFVWNNANAMTNTAQVAVYGATLNGLYFLTDSAIGGLSGNGGVIMSGRTLTVGHGNGSSTFSGTFGGGTLTMLGGGTFTLDHVGSVGSLDYLNVTNGYLVVRDGAQLGVTALGNTSVVTVTNAGTMIINATGQLTASNLYVRSGGTVQQLNTAGPVTVANLQVSSGGTYSLNGGTLTITAQAGISNGADFTVGALATLKVQKTAHLQRNLINNGTLGGSGTIVVNGGSGAVYIQAGGVQAPGNSPGTQTVVGTNVWLAGGSYQWEINDWAGTKGNNPGWDWLNVIGVLSNDATQLNPFIIDITSLNGVVSGASANFDNSATYSNIIATGVSVANFATNYFSLVTTNFQNAFDGRFALTLVNGTNLVLSYTGQEVYTWKDATGDFSVNSNWRDGAAPPVGKTNVVLYFGGSTLSAYVASNDLTGLFTKRVTLTNNTATLQTISGNNLTLVGLAPEIDQNGTGAFLVNNDLVLTKTVLLAGTGSGTVELAGTLSDSGGLTKTGGWTLVLSGANTYNGLTTMRAGQLLVANVDALQNTTLSNLVNGGVSFTNVTTANLGGLAGNGNLGLTNTSGAALTLNVGGNGASTRYDGVLSGLGAVVKVGSGNLVLSNVNTYQGGTVVSAGTLTASAVGDGIGGTGSSIGSGGLIINGGTMRFGISSLLPVTNTVNGSVALYGGTLSAAGVYNVGQVMVGGGYNTMVSDLFNTGVVSNNAGTLLIGATGTGMVTNSGTIALAGGVLIAGTITNPGTVVGYGSLSAALANSALVSATNGQLNLDGPVSGAGTYRAEAGATLSFNGGGSLSRLFNTGGTIRVASTVTNSTVFRNAGTLAPAGGTYYTPTVLTNGATARIIGYGTVAAAGALVNQGTINNPFPTTPPGSTLVIDSALANTGFVGADSGRKLVVSGVFSNNGTLSLAFGGLGTFNSAVVNRSAWLQSGGSDSLFNNNVLVTSNGYITADNGSVLTFTGNLLNQSTNNLAWDTMDATLGTNTFSIGTGGRFVFSGTSVTETQEFTHPGLLLTGGFTGSPSPSSNGVQDVTSFAAVTGFDNNFAVAQLWLTNTTLSLLPTVPMGPVGALFVQDLYLFGGAQLVINDNVRLYFINSNSWDMANVTLLGSAEIHQLNSLELPPTLAVPEPNVLVMWLAGAITLHAARRRARAGRTATKA